MLSQPSSACLMLQREKVSPVIKILSGIPEIIVKLMKLMGATALTLLFMVDPVLVVIFTGSSGMRCQDLLGILPHIMNLGEFNIII